ncbi:MAG: hypothetical protein EOP84_17240 [Verrucomicrobiaceae bacterium]|nr:MAG: hypothetical protein EOP84_17240 [Verrucomicrobiaceae bacterium]
MKRHFGRKEAQKAQNRNASGDALRRGRVELERIRGSWCLGGESFRERMLGIVETVVEKAGGGEPLPSSAKSTPHDRTEAERLIRVGLAYFGLRDQDLRELRKGGSA